jgi:D-3-phosphoglycerate dehydrogenase
MQSMKILVASSVYPDTIAKLREQHDVITAFNANDAELRSLIQDRDALIFRSGVNITAEVMATAPDLKLLVRAGSGLDNLDLDYVKQHKLTLVRVPEPGAQAVAELSFAMMLALSRRLIEADQLTRQGHWAKSTLTGYLLYGKTLGIVGAGNIGSRAGRMGVAWGMNVVGCVERPSPDVAEKLQAQGIRLTDLDEVLSTSDYLSVHVPLQESTRGMIGAAQLAKIKSGAYLINLARGGVVDEEALYKELTTDGRLRGAGLDVHKREGEGKVSPLAELPNVILTPHIGATTVDTQREIGRRVIEIVEAYIAEQYEAVAG